MTIYALSTGPGISGIAIVRVSGEDTKKVIKLLTNVELPKPRVATLRKINKINTSELIDEGIILWFPGPESYTGEDMAEFHIHGSKAVIDALHHSISKIVNCRLAEAGEFTKLAFQNGKINLLKAESIADLISAETEIQRQQAIKIMNGKSADKFNSLREKLLKILSHVEAKIDFPDEDLPEDILKNIKKISNEVILNIKKILDDQKVGERIREGFKIAIIGPTNAGKSSLLNHLSNRDAAIVSEIAGTTRDAIEDELIIDGVAFRFIDTAGIRETNDRIESIGIKKAYEKAENAQLIIFLIDSNKFSKSKEVFLSEIATIKNRFPKKRVLVIANKIDTISTTEKNEIRADIDDILLLSAKENIGVETLLMHLTSLVNKGALSNNETIVTNSRHFEALNNALTAIISVKKGIDLEISTDLFSIDIRECLRHLGNITGEYDVDKDILGHIFSNFCIGK